MALKAFKPSIPFQGTFTGRVTPGFNLFIVGTPTKNTRFDINLAWNSTSPQRKVIFHFNPRFTENQVVRNTLSTQWGSQETYGGIPFKVGETFQLQITAGQSAFQVEVNGNHFCTYNYRFPLDMITNLEITKDVIIHNIHTQ